LPTTAKFYLNGGGLFTVQGRWWDEQVESLFEELGASVYYPWVESKEGELRAKFPHEESRRRIFLSDRYGVDVSQGVIMLGEGAAGEVSSGTAWELGYAYARKKVILCIRTDFRGTLNPILKENLSYGDVCGNLGDLRIQARRAIGRIRRSAVIETSYAPPARPRRIRKVYLSAPYFSVPEEAYAHDIESGLARLGFDVLFPQGEDKRKDFDSADGRFWQREFKKRVGGLEESDAVVALLEGADCGTETSWDCGFAYSEYKPVFGLRTDFRSCGDLAGPVNLMLEQSLVGTKLCTSAREAGRMLKAWH